MGGLYRILSAVQRSTLATEVDNTVGFGVNIGLNRALLNHGDVVDENTLGFGISIGLNRAPLNHDDVTCAHQS